MSAVSSVGGIRVQGALLPPDVLNAVVSGSLDGLDGPSFHLGSESPREAAARAWSHLQGAYKRFRAEVERLPEGDRAVGVTRERWVGLLLNELGYGRVPLTGAGGLAVGDKSYPVSHLWEATPIHQLGWRVELDTRTPGVPGAAQRAPHAMVQELLNRTDDYLWAILTNGRVLRLLRDSTTLTGQAFVEFDLEAMFDGDQFADFVVLYLLAHQSRVEVPADGVPVDCWLEKWRVTAVHQGVRALSLLREGVERALEELGTGFLQHPGNQDLRDRIAAGEISEKDVHQALLRVAYRFLFWSVAEDRDALHAPEAGAAERERYADYFSSRRLRELALRRHGTRHHDMWRSVGLVWAALGESGEQRLGLPGLGGLFRPSAVDVLDGCELPNTALLAAVRHLSVVQPKGQPQRRVDFAHLGAEELGSIYESLLELVPRYDPVRHDFSLEVLAGNDRKTSGSYYTPSELVELVLDTALDPVLDDAEKRARTAEEAEAELLGLRVCDPAVGSAHFLVAAARRIATRVAVARTGEVDPTPTSFSEALHDVVARCLYGVDVNPMAADLAKVSLWLTAMTPGRPLSFLDHHIKVGNALLGATPALMADGVPDAAYVALTGDDKQVVKDWKKLNKSERDKDRGQGEIFGTEGLDVDAKALREGLAEVAERSEKAQSVADVAWAAQRYADLQADRETQRARQVADAWCAAFLGPKTTGAVPITTGTLDAIAEDSAGETELTEIARIAARHRLFHWHFEFPEVFTQPLGGWGSEPYGWAGGFDAVLGNPPWERVKLQEQEFFATRSPAIAAAANAAARKRAIAKLATSEEEADRRLFADFEDAKRGSEAESQFLRTSGRYPLCGVGDVNTYSVFAEHFRGTLATSGRSGIITPTGLATDATTAAFFADTLRAQRLAAFYDFDNEAKIFDNVHHAFRFAVSSMTGGEAIRDVRMAFVVRHIADVPTRRFALAADEVLLVNPNTGTLPVFRGRRDAEVTLACYRAHPVLMRDGGDNPWGLRFGTLFHMANDSGLFRTADSLEAIGATFDGWAWHRGDERWLPLYEAKMLSHWNSRFSTYEGATQAQLNMGTLPRFVPEQLDDPDAEVLARYWVAEDDVRHALPHSWDREWLLGFRRLTRSSDLRTLIPFALPRSAVGDNAWTALGRSAESWKLQAVLSSFVADYIIRQKLSGTTLSAYIVEQLACPAPHTFDEKTTWAGTQIGTWLRGRVLELTYVGNRLASYAVDVLQGTPGVTDPGPAFRWMPDRRAQLQAEVEAAMMHVYGLDRADAEHVLDSFPIVRKYEERDHGEFRTKRLVLAAYDAMTEAAATGVPYESPLDPPPGEGPRHPRRSEHDNEGRKQ